MKESVYKSYDELPLFISSETLSELLGISLSSCYELMHEKDFPVIRIGKRMVDEMPSANSHTPGSAGT